MSIVEWAIIAFIVLSIVVHVWRGGAANPESTGALSRRVGELTNKLSQVSTRVGQVEKGLSDLKDEAATTDDIGKLKEVIDEKFNTVAATMEGQRALSETTGRNVQRIYDIMLAKGLGAK